MVVYNDVVPNGTEQGGESDEGGRDLIDENKNSLQQCTSAGLGFLLLSALSILPEHVYEGVEHFL